MAPPLSSRSCNAEDDNEVRVATRVSAGRHGIAARCDCAGRGRWQGEPERAKDSVKAELKRDKDGGEGAAWVD